MDSLDVSSRPLITDSQGCLFRIEHVHIFCRLSNRVGPVPLVEYWTIFSLFPGCCCRHFFVLFGKKDGKKELLYASEALWRNLAQLEIVRSSRQASLLTSVNTPTGSNNEQKCRPHPMLIMLLGEISRLQPKPFNRLFYSSRISRRDSICFPGLLS
jgi:hypothetical protein